MSMVMEENMESNGKDLMSLEELLHRIGVKPSENQMDMIKHKDSPLNGLSCAGSGKTTTMITKVLKMEFVDGVNPTKILMVTFSKAGADEMKARHEKECKKLGKKSMVEIRTFHSTFLYILKKFYKRINILDESERSRILSRLCRKHIKKYNEETFDNFNSLLGFSINNMLFTKNAIVNTPKFLTTGIDWEDYNEVCEEYNGIKEEKEAMDFDDLQIKCYNLLSNDSAALDSVQGLWDYYIVDEFQDVSKLQLELLKLLVKNPNNLTTIGDDDQCIYEWRGSSIDYIIDMPIHFPGTKRVIMDTNYRCPTNILEQIVPSIEVNHKRVPKQMKAFNEGGKVKVVYTKGLKDCSGYIAENIIGDEKYHGKLSEIAILYRNHSQAMYVVDMLLRKNVPIQLKNPAGLLYNYPMVKDFKDIVLFAINQSNPLLFKNVGMKIINYLSLRDLNKIVDLIREQGLDWIDAYSMVKGSVDSEIYSTKANLDHIYELVENNSPMCTMISYLDTLYHRRKKFMIDKLGFAEKELNDIESYLVQVTQTDTFEKFYKFIDVAKGLIGVFNKVDNAVKIMTMHTCKGLEFDKVYLLNDSEEHCPSSYIESRILKEFGEREADRYIEQERRLHYVAWTRAKKELIVTVDLEKQSRFLEETAYQRQSSENKIEEVYYDLY